MSLNPKQLEAVNHGEGPLLILAGAGSGKTRVLVHRIARLLEEGLAAPYEVLAVTFTNKAARELVERCADIVGPPAADLWAGTFHSIGARLLRRHAEVIDYKPTYTIYDTDDQKKLIKDLLADTHVDEAMFPPDAVRAFIEACKNEGLLPGASAIRRDDTFSSKAAEIYAAYQSRLHTLGAMDFGDLIVQPAEMFRRAPELLERYQRRFRFVLVDEYQDTNRAQYNLIKLFAGGHGNLCVVGDDDQSIYAWRGADIRNILEFEHDFTGAHVVHLEQNYRSTSNIIDAAHAVIANNATRKPKKIWTANDPGSKLHQYTAADERDEARYIVSKLYDLGESRKDAAIFYRTNAQSRVFEDELVRNRMRYVIVGTTRFYERREIKDLVAYLRFVHNPTDDLSLGRIINVPTRGIGRITFEKLTVAATEAGIPIWNLLFDGSDPLLRGQARSKIEHFVGLAKNWLESAADATVTEIIERIIDDTGYIAYLESSPGDDALARIENVRELLTVSQEFDSNYDPRELDDEDPNLGPLAVFLEQLSLTAEIDNYDDDAGAVTLMTIHNSKGLEFDQVFMAGMEEGVFPHSRSTDAGSEGMEEERRLCYVGITRARKKLTLLHAVKRHLFGTAQFNFPSRFLEEIPAELMTTEKAKISFAEGASRDNRGRPHAASQVGSQVLPEAELSPSSKVSASGTYKVGMKVTHPMFGVGTVRKCDNSGTDEKLVVQFQRVGLKKLVARYARLQVV